MMMNYERDTYEKSRPEKGQDSGRSDLLMLEQAMTAQKRSVRAYEIMVSAAHSPADKELLRTIGREERRHYYLLEGIYEECCGKAAKLSRPAVSLPRYYPDMLRTAICDKLEVIDHLERLQEKIHCVRQKDMLTIVLCDQKEHARILAAIYRRCH